MTPRQRDNERRRELLANICFAIALVMLIIYAAMGGDLMDR